MGLGVGRRRLALAGELVLAFPITRVDILGEFLDQGKSVRFSDLANLVLEARRECLVKGASESRFAPFDLRGEAIEIDHESDDALVFSHREMFQLGFGIPNGIVGTEILPKLGNEVVEIEEPGRRIIGIHFGDAGFKPIERDALEVREGEVDFSVVVSESAGLVVEIETTLNQEGAKLLWVVAVEGIGFSDFGSGTTIATLNGPSKVSKGFR
jgi:hypothetical protein